MSDPFVGQITLFGGNFAPAGWALCDGQLLSIAQNTALFSILGTTYGGDGEVTFGLPDLRGRVPIHPGNGPGLQQVSLGQKSGANQVNLTVGQLPSHTHTLRANSDGADNTNPEDRTLAEAREDTYNEESPNVDMMSGSVGATGGNQPVSIMQPYLGVNYIIALIGVFPS